MTEQTHQPDLQGVRLLTVPGLFNSGPGHWQSIWEDQLPNCQRVELGLWDRPHRNTWVNNLNHAIRAADGPVILLAHSLGCLAVAWWVALERPSPSSPVRGALLVAPPQVDHDQVDPRLASFAPAPPGPLPFPAILVGSRNDPYISLPAARRLARHWSCGFADAGAVGHINAESDLGDWGFGQFLLGQLLRSAERGDPSPIDRPAPANSAPANPALANPALANPAPSTTPLPAP